MRRGLLTPENKKKYVEPGLEKQALLARLTSKAMEAGVGVGNLFRALNPKSPMTFRKAFPVARRYARYSEPRLRDWVGEEIGSRAARGVDLSTQGLDKTMHMFSRGQVGFPVNAREKILRTVAKDPVSLAGVSLSFSHPVPMAIPGSFLPGVGSVGITSRLAKKALGVPVTDVAAMRALDKHYRAKGYAHTRDFLERSTAAAKAKPYQGVPDVSDTQKALRVAGGVPGVPFF